MAQHSLLQGQTRVTDFRIHYQFHVLVITLLLVAVISSARPSSTATNIQCQGGWTGNQRGFCYKGFRGMWAKRTFQLAQQKCRSLGAGLVSKDDVDGVNFTEGTFWVAEKVNSGCQAFKPTSKKFTTMPCSPYNKRYVVCKSAPQNWLEFCEGQEHSGTLSTNFHTRKYIEFCIVSFSHQNPPNAHMFKAAGKTKASHTSIMFMGPRETVVPKHFEHVGLAFDPSYYMVLVETDGLLKDDLGDWIIEVNLPNIKLQFKLKVEATGPPTFCLRQTNRITQTMSLGDSRNLSVCVLSPHAVESVNAHKQSVLAKTGESKQSVHASLDHDKSKPPEYYVDIQIENLAGNDVGTWTVDIYAANYTISYGLVIDAQGPPQCPPEVNVTGQTSHSVTLTWLVGHNGGAPQTFIILYNYNTSSNVQMWHRNNVSSPDNTTTVSDTVEHLPANTSILFQVVGVNKFNEDSVDLSMCAAPTWARTYTQDHSDVSKTEQPSAFTIFNLLHIAIGVAVLAVITMTIVCIGILVSKRRASSMSLTRQKEGLLENSHSTSPTEDAQYLYVNAGTMSIARASVDQTPRQPREEDAGPMNVVLLSDPVYESSQDTADQIQFEDCRSRCNDEIPYEPLGADGGDDSTLNRRLTTFAPRQKANQIEQVEYMNIYRSKSDKPEQP